jgi:hypothetical protein
MVFVSLALSCSADVETSIAGEEATGIKLLATPRQHLTCS